MPRLAKNAPCPCHSGRKAKGCCAPWFEGALPPTPEALMRSRYTAYASGNCAYLIATTHPGGKHWQPDRSVWMAELAGFCAAIRFDGLRIESAVQNGDHGEVTFHATLRQGERDASFTEHSRFIREDGRWFYVEAVR